MHPFYFMSFEIGFHFVFSSAPQWNNAIKDHWSTPIDASVKERKLLPFTIWRPFIPSWSCIRFDVKISTRKILAITIHSGISSFVIASNRPANSSLGFCTLCFCFPTKMLHLNAPFFPALGMLDRSLVIKMLLIPNVLRRYKVNKNVQAGYDNNVYKLIVSIAKK